MNEQRSPESVAFKVQLSFVRTDTGAAEPIEALEGVGLTEFVVVHDGTRVRIGGPCEPNRDVLGVITVEIYDQSRRRHAKVYFNRAMPIAGGDEFYWDPRLAELEVGDTLDFPVGRLTILDISPTDCGPPEYYSRLRSTDLNWSPDLHAEKALRHLDRLPLFRPLLRRLYPWLEAPPRLSRRFCRDADRGLSGPRFQKYDHARWGMIVSEAETAVVEDLEQRRRKWWPAAFIGPLVLALTISLFSLSGKRHDGHVLAAALFSVAAQLPLMTFCHVQSTGALSALVAGLLIANYAHPLDPALCLFFMLITAWVAQYALKTFQTDQHLWPGYVDVPLLCGMLFVVPVAVDVYKGWHGVLDVATACGVLLLMVWRIAVLRRARLKILMRLAGDSATTQNIGDLLRSAADGLSFWRYVRKLHDLHIQLKVVAMAGLLIMLLHCLALFDFQDRIGFSESKQRDLVRLQSNGPTWLYQQRGTLLTYGDLRNLNFYLLSEAAHKRLVANRRGVYANGQGRHQRFGVPETCENLGEGAMRITAPSDLAKAPFEFSRLSRSEIHAWRCQDGDPHVKSILTPVRFVGYFQEEWRHFDRRVPPILLHTALFTAASFFLFWTWQPIKGQFGIAVATWAFGVGAVGPLFFSGTFHSLADLGQSFLLLPTNWSLDHHFPTGLLAMSQVVTTLASWLISLMGLLHFTGITTAAVIDKWAGSHSDVAHHRSGWVMTSVVRGVIAVGAAWASSTFIVDRFWAIAALLSIPLFIVGLSLWFAWAVRRELRKGIELPFYHEQHGPSVASKALFIAGSLSPAWILTPTNPWVSVPLGCFLAVLFISVIWLDDSWKLRRSIELPTIVAGLIAVAIEVVNQLAADEAEKLYIVPHILGGLISLGLSIAAFEKLKGLLGSQMERRVLKGVPALWRISIQEGADNPGAMQALDLQTIMGEVGLPAFLVFTRCENVEFNQVFQLNSAAGHDSSLGAVAGRIELSNRLVRALKEERILRPVRDQLDDPNFALCAPELWRLQGEIGGPYTEDGDGFFEPFCKALLAVSIGNTVLALVAISGAIPRKLAKEPTTRALHNAVCGSIAKLLGPGMAS